jgi:hypothetical protein
MTADQIRLRLGGQIDGRNGKRDLNSGESIEIIKTATMSHHSEKQQFVLDG